MANSPINYLHSSVKSCLQALYYNFYSQNMVSSNQTSHLDPVLNQTTK